MGILLDDQYWSRAANGILEERPTPMAVMSDESARRALSIVCRSLSDLADDEDLDADIKKAKEFAKKGEDKLQDFGKFVREFVRVERAILLQSGVDMEAAEKMLTEAKNLSTQTNKIRMPEESFRDFKEKVRLCAKMSCNAASQPLGEIPDNIKKDFVKAAVGIAMIGIDAGCIVGAAATFPVATGIVANVSIGVGGGIFTNVMDRWW